MSWCWDSAQNLGWSCLHFQCFTELWMAHPPIMFLCSMKTKGMKDMVMTIIFWKRIIFILIFLGVFLVFLLIYLLFFLCREWTLIHGHHANVNKIWVKQCIDHLSPAIIGGLWKKKCLAEKHKLSIYVRSKAQKMEGRTCYCLATLLFQFFSLEKMQLILAIQVTVSENYCCWPRSGDLKWKP